MLKGLFVKSALVAFATVGAVAQAQWFDPCNASYNGTWNFRGGRPMDIYVQRTGGNSVSVTVAQSNGSETLWGTCNRRPNGTARISFDGGTNNGRLVVSSDGYANGSVAGFGYSGYAR